MSAVNIAGFIIPAGLLVSLCSIGCSESGGAMIIILCITLSGIARPVLITNHMDIAPDYSG